ncbi:hypothetical protein [Kutzneria sp. NPDC052558]|uniref:hypothetical protein n=1 Tax=Kutzneria sp. NPDC052558 TaxID=3364121 RepID=UPI0037CA8CF4
MAERVVSVAAGMQETEQVAAVRDGRHEALAVLIGNWINEGITAGGARIVTSDVYEWAPGGFFVLHKAFGRIGEAGVGGVEMIGVDGDGYVSTFYDSFGNVHRSRLEIEGDELRWLRERTRCTVTLADGGTTQIGRHEASPDGVTWSRSMDVTLRKV